MRSPSMLAQLALGPSEMYFAPFCTSAGTTPGSGADKVVKIGVIAPLDKGLVEFGAGIKNSAQLAIDQANAKGAIPGYKIEIEAVDMLDGTPLLDIKPYVPAFDDRPGASIGWFAGRLDRLVDARSDGRFRRG